MTEDRTTALVVSALVVLAAVPAGVLALTAAGGQQSNGDDVNVTTGQQLSTVLAVTSEDVEHEYEESTFEAEYERGSESSRAEAVAERAESLRERAEAIREDYEAATEAYEAGEISKTEYARRLATLNARAERVAEAYDRLQERAADVSALELRAAGLNRTAVRAAVRDLDTVRGAGASALLERFTGETRGEVELETDDGLAISVTSEDGERTREVERPGDGSTALTVSQRDALETARAALSDANGTWTLADTGFDRESGTYAFEFRLRSNRTVGEAEVEVDGSADRAVSVEEELEARHGAGDDAEGADGDGDDADAGDDGDRGGLALLVADGTPAPNETVTVQVLAAGEPVAGVPVTLDGERVGRTDSDGTVQVTLPDGDEVTLRAERGERDGELEFEFGGEDEREEREVHRNLDAAVTVDDGTATATVTYDGEGVEGATVFANDRRAGTTGADGVVSFSVPDGTDELEVTVEKGEFEAEFEFERRNGSFVRTDGGDGDDGDEQREQGSGEEQEDDGGQQTETESGEQQTETETETESGSNSGSG